MHTYHTCRKCRKYVLTTCMGTYLRTSRQIGTCMSLCAYVYIYMCTHKIVYLLFIYTYTYRRTYIQTHTHTYPCMRIHAGSLQPEDVYAEERGERWRSPFSRILSGICCQCQKARTWIGWEDELNEFQSCQDPRDSAFRARSLRLHLRLTLIPKAETLAEGWACPLAADAKTVSRCGLAKHAQRITYQNSSRADGMCWIAGAELRGISEQIMHIP